MGVEHLDSLLDPSMQENKGTQRCSGSGGTFAVGEMVFKNELTENDRQSPVNKKNQTGSG
jgi:hypothetical protein